MVAPQPVLTSRGEAAVSQIRHASAVFQRLDALERQSQSRIDLRASSLPPSHLLLPRIVSIAEDFTRGLLIECSERVIDTSHPLSLDIWTQAEKQAEATWQNLRVAWTNWHSIDLTQAPDHLAFTGFVEARNAIMHGLGELTRRQSRTPAARAKTVSRLGHAHLKVDGHRLVIGAPALLEAMRVATGVVEWLDHEAVDSGVAELV